MKKSAFEAYVYFVKMKLMTSFIYRFEFFASVFGGLVVMFATVFLWKTVFHAVDKVDGLRESQMVTYAILAGLLGVIFNVRVEKAMYERVLQGDIAMDYIRPINILMCYLAEDIGIAIGALISRFIPMLIFVSLFFFIPAPASLAAFLLFIPSAFMSFMIVWLTDAIIGVTHMKFLDLGSVTFIKEALILLISGGLVPIWFFPEKLQVVLSFLPFQYTYQSPLGIYIGKYSVYDALVTLNIQALWIALLFWGLNLIWGRFSKNVLAQGG